MKEVAEALKLLASYMKEGFEKTFKIFRSTPTYCNSILNC